MRTIFSFILILFFGCTGNARGERKQTNAWQVISNTPSKTVATTATWVEFKCKQNGGTTIPFKTIVYSHNGSANQQATTNAKGVFSTKLVPGKTKFIFFYTADFDEIYTDSIDLKPAHHVVVELFFNAVSHQIICDKPVIYLYPEAPTTVTVNLAAKGELLFTYPEYAKGWELWCNPDGTFIHKEKTYNYLFWEATATAQNHKVNQNQGNVVETSKLVSFFESTLEKAGLNSKEAADFITYWVPRMKAYKKHKIQFVFHEDVNAYATLQVNPKPQNMLRLFMLWTPLAPDENPVLEPQVIPSFSRKGFTVVEWGGTQLEKSF